MSCEYKSPYNEYVITKRRRLKGGRGLNKASKQTTTWTTCFIGSLQGQLIHARQPIGFTVLVGGREKLLQCARGSASISTVDNETQVLGDDAGLATVLKLEKEKNDAFVTITE